MENILGKKKITQAPVSIQSVVDEAEKGNLGPFVVKGQVFEVNIIKTRRGGYINKCAIFDGLDEIAFQAFSDDELNISENDYLLIQGEAVKNEYTSWEWALDISLAEKIIIPKNIEKDLAKTTRVELQSFLQMSKMRSTLSYDEYFEYLASIGHTHGAITDTAGVQGFPEAYKASKKHGVQLILGATVPLASEDNKVAYNPIDKPLRGTTYVSFDVETTGLSSVDDRVIEIGAIKQRDGETLERFQCFVKVDIPIPKFTTELTGITQKMIDEHGISLKNAIEMFDDFIGDAILVAHNATFDRDFISESYKQVDMDFKVDQRTFVDTLEISRSLEPDARGHRLNQVTKRMVKEFDNEVKELKKELKSIERELKANSKKKADLQEDLSDLNNRAEEIQKRIQFLNGEMKNLNLENHHRADEDSEVTGYALMQMIPKLEALGITNINQLNDLLQGEAYKRSFPKEVSLLALTEVGKKNLFRILTQSHVDQNHRGPRATKTLINKYREGLLVGSGSHHGLLFELVTNKPIEQAIEDAKFYDYIEIQPSEIAGHLVQEDRIGSMEQIETAWKKIYAIGTKLNKPVVATGHVHYLNKEDSMYHNILLYHEVAGLDPEKRNGRLKALREQRHLRTTEEMMNAFPWLDEQKRYEVVVENTRKIAEKVEDFPSVPDALYPPKIDGANEELRELAYNTAKSIYGQELPEYVKARLEKELNSIIGNGFAVIYLISQKLVKNSIDNGYLVGSRGSVGSSFVATMTGITEVNPLKPHYVSKSNSWNVFFDHPEIGSGYDLPTCFSVLLDENSYSESCQNHVIERFAKSFGKSKEETIAILKNHKENTCPITGEQGLIRDGQDIPFETFLGFKGDKVPDIDLNFSGEYQTTSHKYVEELFGKKYVFRAGTIGTVAEKKAFGYVASYAEENGLKWSILKIRRFAKILNGAKATSGQHPGGILVVPDYMEAEDFTPVQHPAEDASKGVRTSHFDFHTIHDNILKLDILGHDDPTIIRMLQDLTGIDPTTVAPNDPMALKLFTAPEDALGINMKDISSSTGTLGVPEFGTEFVQQMIEDTKPTKFAELIKISGLSHGTDVWLGNAKNLIDDGTCTISEVIDTRDAIMVYLQQMGLDDLMAFKIMEDVRKGKGLKPEYIEEMKKQNVPDWYIKSCQLIKYMFPKAHAAAYVLSAMRIANFKVYHPKEFYAAVLSVRYGDEDITELNQEPSVLRTRIVELTSEISKLKNSGEANRAGKRQKLKNAMELMLEAKVRGVKFGSISLEKSNSLKYTIHDGIITPPFISIPGLGEVAAISLREEFDNKPFTSVDDMNNRTGVTKTNIGVLRDMGCLERIEDIQCTLF